MNKQSLKCHFKITSLNSLKGNDIALPANKTYKIAILYPFKDTYYYVFKTSNGIGLAMLLKHIHKAFISAYDKVQDKGEAYYHGIEDVALHTINVNHKSKMITFDIGD
ncbi:hypothetical protein UFOVP1290_286 [uncultured Caudovirales phage]|uniref:Uncharacterized protein n=1 Tax=uncultured Caudovirales phage TaxID=2100421 RepID=A0A6J5RR37_9CAUD|nr:hypothetical protein UFOVP1290_286 [uncultured Caudovirales phage]